MITITKNEKGEIKSIHIPIIETDINTKLGQLDAIDKKKYTDKSASIEAAVLNAKRRKEDKEKNRRIEMVIIK